LRLNTLPSLRRGNPGESKPLGAGTGRQASCYYFFHLPQELWKLEF